MAARKPGPVATAAASGDQRATLEAIRDQLAGQLEKAPPDAERPGGTAGREEGIEAR